MCRDPFSDAVATLVVVPDSEGVDEIEAAIERAGGSIEAHLEFDALRVRIPETQVKALCSIADIDRVETAAVVSQPGSGETPDSDDETK